MCDFKVGDEVVRIRDEHPPHPLDTTGTPPIGHVGRVIEIGISPVSGRAWIELDNWPVDPNCGHRAGDYRKVVRSTDKLTIEAFLTIKLGFEEPRRPKAPAKKRERA